MKNLTAKTLDLIDRSLKSPPRGRDVLVMSLFFVAITFYPYYLNNRINVFELGLYLPGINAILHGLVPYRDFFHLRGPLELYAPAWLMKVFGVHMATLCFYFFVGNVLCFIVMVMICRELLRTRFIFYTMLPAIIARAWPRVVFGIWGGMRYTFGLLAVYCLVRFIKGRHWAWALASGFLTALAGLVSFEMGVYAGLAAGAAAVVIWTRKTMTGGELGRGILAFAAALALGASPWLIYAGLNHALVPYFEAAWTIVSRMQTVIDPHQVSIYPHNFSETLAMMLNPFSINFRQLSVAYLYIFLLGYLIMRWSRGRGGWKATETILLALGVYGFIMYNTAFRCIWAAQFEMSLLPEKVLYSYLLEAVVLWLWANKEKFISWKKSLICFLIFALFGFSWGFAIYRFNSRFWSFQYICRVLSFKSTARMKFWDKHDQYKELAIPRVNGVWVPVDEYEDLNKISDFLKAKAGPDDVVVGFPELGMYNFIFDRPFLGRFPLPTFSWFHEQWYDEFLQALKSGQAKFVIVQKTMLPEWYQVYFGYPPNKAKFDQMLAVISARYVQAADTGETRIYERF